MANGTTSNMRAIPASRVRIKTPYANRANRDSREQNPMRSDDGNVPPRSTSIADAKVDGDNVLGWPTGPPVTDGPSGPAESEPDGGNVPHRPIEQV